MITINPFLYNQKSEPDLFFIRSLAIPLNQIMNQQFWQNNDLQTEKTLSKNLSSTMKQVKITKRFHRFFLRIEIIMAWTDLTHFNQFSLSRPSETAGKLWFSDTFKSMEMEYWFDRSRHRSCSVKKMFLKI